MAESEIKIRNNRIAPSNVGPELSTLAEKFVAVLRLPYTLGCIIWALVFLEIPILIQQFSDKPHYNIRPDIIFLIVVFLMSVYFPLSVRFVRARVLEAEPKLTPLLPDGEADYHKAFGPAVSNRGQIIAMIAIALLAIYFIVKAETLIDHLVYSICTAYIAMMFGSLIWFNLRCTIGLFLLGGKPLKFKPFREDSTLGTRPIGSLSLSLASAYSAGVVILILFSIVSPDKSFFTPYLLSVYAVLILAGIVVFVLALFRVHFRMVEEKNRQDILIQKHFDCTSHYLKSREGEDPLVNIQNLLSLDMADRKLQAISTWPLDTSLLGKLLTILLAVTAALIVRAVGAIFGWWTPGS